MCPPHAYLLATVSVTVMIFLHPALGAPHHRFAIEELGEGFEKPMHRFYLPIEIAPAALAGALKAHARNSLGSDLAGDPEAPYDLVQQKRTTSGLEMFEPLAADALEQEPSLFSGIKRKMFWQPLGYMPASARAHHSNNKGSSGNRNSAQDNGSNVFRYG